jgi:hypothetical protein
VRAAKDFQIVLEFATLHNRHLSGCAEQRHKIIPGSIWIRARARPYGEQEGSAYNGHFGCMCYHPAFVFNQLGDVERLLYVHSA